MKGEVEWTVQRSEIDKSVNFIGTIDSHAFECRYVSRKEDSCIVYVSSGFGCNQGCRFCHLTASKKTDMTRFSFQLVKEQIARVFDHMKEFNIRHRSCHLNFMSRSDYLLADSLKKNYHFITNHFNKKCSENRMTARYHVSTIIPKTFKQDLSEVFWCNHPTLFYSLYSAKPEWRAHWLPNAAPLDYALEALKKYQDFSKKIVKIHYPLIKGENDGWGDARLVGDMILKYELVCELNLIEYNPPDDTSCESDQETIDFYCALLANVFKKIKRIPRVGFDVNASCGMFS